MYIGETNRNVKTRWDEHEDVRKNSEPAKHLLNDTNGNHSFQWRIICNAPSNFRQRRNLEANYISMNNPNLNNQSDSKVLILFRNGIT